MTLYFLRVNHLRVTYSDKKFTLLTGSKYLGILFQTLTTLKLMHNARIHELGYHRFHHCLDILNVSQLKPYLRY